MGRCRFEKPDVVRLPLSNDDWIEVRRRLSGGEKRRMSAASFTDVKHLGEGEAQRIGVDFAALGLSRMKAYVTDWSFRDERDKPVKVTPESIEALDEETMVEIDEALDAHIEAVVAESKVPSGEPASSPDLPSAGI